MFSSWSTQKNVHHVNPCSGLLIQDIKECTVCAIRKEIVRAPNKYYSEKVKAAKIENKSLSVG